MSTSIHLLLKRYFGYDNFRGQQQEIINHTLQKKDSLVIMPTGGGKSLCYQIPAISMEGTAIIISPLIALMKDQVDALRANGIPAAAMNSNSTPEDLKHIFNAAGTEALKLLYVSPEKAVSHSFINFIKEKKVNLIAIDEAHCVSIWGNDFRLEYTQLPILAQNFPSIPVIALTATADKATQTDIVDKLKLKNKRRFISSFERKNLNIKVLPANNRLAKIIDFISKRKNQSGIIYCLSRKSTEMVADKLREVGISAFHYHAEMSAEERNGVQKAFQQDEIKVVCATIAFGMGIDKSNVRYVLHYNLPKNIESYYQEIGRAGRDGFSAETILFFSLNDGQIFQSFIEKSEADENFKQVQRAKLKRIIEFCQSTSCRTNMILSYFGEYRSEGCNHCDNCKNPPTNFDGSKLAQKVLSAVKEVNEKAALNLIVDIIRGSERKEIIQAGFDRLKSFGSGEKISRDHWQFYTTQLINLGFLEIDFTDHNKLKITEFGEKAFNLDVKVSLAKAQSLETSEYVENDQSMQNAPQLFEYLKNVRMRLAKEQGVPAYIIFHDTTLRLLADVKPLQLSHMYQISGIGKHKLEKYGPLFLDEIKRFCYSHNEPVTTKGTTYTETLNLLSYSYTIDQIAVMRRLEKETILSHILHLYNNGENIHLYNYVSEEELKRVKEAFTQLGPIKGLKEIFTYLNEEVSYNKIRICIKLIPHVQRTPYDEAGVDNSEREK